MDNVYLLINPFGIGDVIFTTPVIQAIKDHQPDAKIYYLCNKRTFSFLNEHPFIEECIVYERDEFVATKKKSFFKWCAKFKEFIRSIREKKINTALDFSMNTNYSFFAMLGGVKRRVGLNYKKRGKFLTKKLAIAGFSEKHVADYYADIARLAGIPVNTKELTFYYDTNLKSFADQFCRDEAIEKNHRMIGMAPFGGQAWGSEAEAKQWPKKNFAQLIKELAGDENNQIVLIGSQSEGEEIEEIIVSSGVDKDRIHTAYNNTIPQTAALIDRCELFISNDSGLLHVADGLKKKCIALFGPVDDKVYGFYPFNESKHVVLCTKPECWPCYQNFRLPPCDYDRKCLYNITVQQVMDEVDRLL